jgi:hypothetical protein
VKLSISIGYDAERTSDDESPEDVERVLELVGEELRGYVDSIRRRVEAEGLRVEINEPAR